MSDKPKCPFCREPMEYRLGSGGSYLECSECSCATPVFGGAFYGDRSELNDVVLRWLDRLARNAKIAEAAEVAVKARDASRDKEDEDLYVAAMELDYDFWGLVRQAMEATE